jgi:DNA-binding transcriptional ArsR family regulator
MKRRTVERTAARGADDALAASELERFADVLKALANPARLRLVTILARGEHSVSQLCELSGLKQSLVSQQLKILRLSNIVRSRRDMPHIYYRLTERNVIRMLGCLSRCESVVSARQRDEE